MKELTIPVNITLEQMKKLLADGQINSLRVHKSLDDHSDFDGCVTNRYGIVSKPWGIQGWYEFSIENFPFRIGFAFIDNSEGSSELSQNYHSHNISGETVLIHAQGKGNYIYSNGNKIVLPEGRSAWYFPPGCPHDIVTGPNNRLTTTDPKLFIFGQRKDDISHKFVAKGNDLPFKLDGELVTVPPYNWQVLYNPTAETIEFWSRRLPANNWQFIAVNQNILEELMNNYRSYRSNGSKLLDDFARKIIKGPYRNEELPYEFLSDTNNLLIAIPGFSIFA